MGSESKVMSEVEQTLGQDTVEETTTPQHDGLQAFGGGGLFHPHGQRGDQRAVKQFGPETRITANQLFQ